MTMEEIIRRSVEEVYRVLGGGWRESVYREALAIELRHNGCVVGTEMAFPVLYKERPLSNVRIQVDMIVNDSTIVELKAAPTLIASAVTQCRRYMSNLDMCDGYVVNFSPTEASVKRVPLVETV